MMMGSRIDLDRFGFSLVVDWCRISFVRCSIFRWVPFLGLGFERALIFLTSARILSDSPRKEARFFFLFFLSFLFFIFIEKGGELCRKGGERMKEKRTYETRF